MTCNELVILSRRTISECNNLAEAIEKYLNRPTKYDIYKMLEVRALWFWEVEPIKSKPKLKSKHNNWMV